MPCFCGATDCKACYGESAQYAGWCDECEYADGCEAAPGSKDCQMKDDVDEAVLEAQLAAREEWA